MKVFDLQRMFFEQLPFSFLAEVALRVLIAYVLVFLFLKASGRRGVRQLSVFELIVILTLGSAAGDVTMYEDVPIAPVITVFFVLLILYRLTTYLMTHNAKFSAWLDGKPITLIMDGRYQTDNLIQLNISENEFFMELRQRGVDHLGQVKLAILETDGNVSVFFFDNTDVRAGLSILPPEHRRDFDCVPTDGQYACNHCGEVQLLQASTVTACRRCGHFSWSVPARNLRSAAGT